MDVTQAQQGAHRERGQADTRWGHAGPFLKMFQACTLVMRRDAQTAMFLLPYIVQVPGLTHTALLFLLTCCLRARLAAPASLPAHWQVKQEWALSVLHAFP